MQEKLLWQASVHTRILEEHRRFQQLTSPYQTIQAQIIHAQVIEAQALQTRALETQALRTLDVFERENTRVLDAADLDRLLTPIDPDLQYKATK
jgi:hypothetical protein